MDLRERCCRSLCLQDKQDPDQLVDEFASGSVIVRTGKQVPAWTTKLGIVNTVMEVISDACAEEEIKRQRGNVQKGGNA